MLDQNTDRMWYVIGAVIVGAAIIFLVNSSFPQLFASVGDTFENKVTEVSKTVESIKKDSNMLNAVGMNNKSWINPDANGVISASGGVERASHGFVTDMMTVDSGVTIRTTQPINLDEYTAAIVAEYDKDKRFIQRPLNRNESKIKDYKLTAHTRYIRYGAKSTSGMYVMNEYKVEIKK